LNNALETLKMYDRLYFESGESPVTDTEYDLLKAEAKKQFPGNPYFDEVGYKSSYKTIKLPFVMGGLDEVGIPTVMAWIKKKLSLITASEKLDGNSIMCSWLNGKLIFAARRSDDEEGNDILEKAIYFIPEIKEKRKVTLRGEVLLEGDSYKYFDFKNARNGVAGLLRRDNINPDDLRRLTVAFYEVIEAPNLDVLNTEYDRFMFIEKILGLPISKVFLFDPTYYDDFPNFLAELLATCKNEAPYDIDGLVLSYNDGERENTKFPRNKVKFKVNSDSAKTTVLDIEWDVTRNGYIKPVILIDPVEILGVTVSRVSGFNWKYILNHMIGKGSVVGVVRSGDVIPYITEFYENKGYGGMNIPSKCPRCNSKLEPLSKDLVCENAFCYYKNYQEVSHFFISMGADGIQDKTIENIKITSVIAMYDLTQEYLEKLPGIGKKKAENILKEVKKTLKVKPEQLLAAFGIPLIGRTLSKQLCSKFTIDELFKIKDPEVLGLGEITSKSIINNIGKYYSLYCFLKDRGLEFLKEDLSTKTLKGIRFALTGEGPMKRSELQKLIESKGGEVRSIGKETSYLVTNDPTSTSGKMKEAKKYNTPIIDYDALLALLKK